MSRPQTSQTDGPTWIRPSKTQATLREHLERATYGDTVRVRAPTGTFELSRRKKSFHVDKFGTGGGWCWNDQWTLTAAVNYVSQWADDDQYDEIELLFDPST